MRWLIFLPVFVAGVGMVAFELARSAELARSLKEGRCRDAGD
ncbi:MAG: hypothetical protein AAB500_02880 [Patescibacteria group bacterium]